MARRTGFLSEESADPTLLFTERYISLGRPFSGVEGGEAGNTAYANVSVVKQADGANRLGSNSCCTYCGPSAGQDSRVVLHQ